MIRHLLALRFRSMMAAGVSVASKKKKSKRSPGMLILIAVLYIYVLAVMGGAMYFLFDSLVTPYHMLGLDWLYFAMAGTIALGLALIGSVFTTQSQLYDAKDNALLLSMPIPPKWILLSRIIPLLSLNLLFCALVMLPAMVVYAISVEFSLAGIALQLLGMVLICILAQALACFLGWLLHLLLRKMNKSFGSMLFMVVFMAIYFGVYSQAGSILRSMAANGQQIADALESWAWPLYALGMGCTGSKLMLIFMAISLGLFALVYWILSMTFLRTATAASKRSRRKLSTVHKIRTPLQAVSAKELRKFLNTPVYLTNMGMGLILTVALPVAGLIFRSDIMELLAILKAGIPNFGGFVPVIICAILSFTVSTVCISTPSVSLEGKNIWILKSMPIAPKDILLGKLRLHVLLTVPGSALSGFVLAVAFGCDLAGILLATLIPALLSFLSGVLGMVTGLKWAKLDYLTEAYPCKQSISILVTMFGLMGLPVILGVGYYFLFDFLSPTAFLAACGVLLAALDYWLLHIMLTWGIRKWNSLY